MNRPNSVPAFPGYKPLPLRPALLFAVVAGCAPAPANSPALAANATRDTVEWKPSWPGTEMAIISGNPFGSGPFVFRFRMPDGYWICPHRHPIDADIRVLAGTFLVGKREVMDTTAVQRLAVGDAIVLQRDMAHYEGAKGLTVIEIHGSGTWGITFLDPRNDPAAAGTSFRCIP